MNAEATEVEIERGARLPTWFGIGGGADLLARPSNAAELVRCLHIDPGLRVLGDGANLLVDDAGVGGLVVSLQTDGFQEIDWDRGAGRVYAGAGVSLPRLIGQSVQRGLGGIAGLAGIPATLGGAVVMNAGGTFGEIGDVVAVVHAVDRAGREHAIERARIDFGYRRSGLGHLLITGVQLALTAGDAEDLRGERQRAMDYKKGTQPLADKSAGCCFKNPTLTGDVDGLGDAGQRVSAGLVLDRAGCKGLCVGGATVSEAHANFIVTSRDARARDVIELMDVCTARVLDTFGVALEREVVVWGRDS
ncbi:MAG: UDP-N-acetylenolpyruvoylglucosamine reductase [Phycisphaeraceae bacterium]|nr:MAG: UDP-N-acetylenolpyruvoylglucosamine reductase [Phycisphaeraceae bacterium]